MITQFKIYENNKFEDGEILVAIRKDLPSLIVGHKYIYQKTGNYPYIKVKDIVNNEPIYKHIDNFVSEEEWERIQMSTQTDKYNL